jgi:hypothetical protein
MLMNDENDLRSEIPPYAYISLARRGMEKISLDQCFLKNCDNSDVKLLEPFKMEENEDDEKIVKKIFIKCKKCGGVYILKLETIKKIAKSTRKEISEKEGDLSIGLAYALDENGNNIGHIGYF